MILPCSYINGTYKVVISPSGAAAMSDPSGRFLPEFPDSIELKVTNHCGTGCSYCYQASTLHGKHGQIAPLLRILEAFPRGMQLAIGGGDPFTWPYLDVFLKEVQNQFVCNITINDANFNRINIQRIADYKNAHQLHGIGISIPGSSYHSAYGYIRDFNRILHEKCHDINNNPIFCAHLIAGLYPASTILHDIRSLAQPMRASFGDEKDYTYNLLILGFKRKGFASKTNNSWRHVVEHNIQFLADNLKQFTTAYSKCRCTISFDNLAIEQLRVRDYLTIPDWDTFYLGPDGSHSFYIDAVHKTSALNSYNAVPRSWRTIHPLAYFRELRYGT